MIAGPITDDGTVDVINGCIAGSCDEDVALRLLLPMKYRDQWDMKTVHSLAAIESEGAIAL